MFSFELVNHPESFSLDAVRISDILHRVNDMVDIPQNGVLNIAILPDEEIQALNLAYRGIDSTTDVLSFHYFEDFSHTSVDEIAGEIILSESRIITQAQEHGHTEAREMEILVIHSILHIIGFDHETDEDYSVMWTYEEPLRSALL